MMFHIAQLVAERFALGACLAPGLTNGGADLGAVGWLGGGGSRGWDLA